jgi:hypothetical protein
MATLDAINQFARGRQMVYLPTHDPESAARLDSCTYLCHRVEVMPMFERSVARGIRADAAAL